LATLSNITTERTESITMRTLKNFQQHNEYVKLPDPKNEDIDLGRYEDSEIRLSSPPVMIDFYRISYKRNYTEDGQNAILFYSPKHPLEWELEEQLEGYYIQLSKSLISRHRYLFQNYMEYGMHEALYLRDSEEREIEEIFASLMRHYTEQPENTPVLISYAHVLVTLIESFYQRQFETDITKYNRIVTEFQQLLHDYYRQEVDQLPNVQYFADQLHVTPNYLGDIIKHHTERTAIETIHDFIIQKAKEHLRESSSNVSQIAYALGFEYPNNFSKFFKHHVEKTPSKYRKSHKPVENEA
jgi:AraC family transcriptional activator of pobA